MSRLLRRNRNEVVAAAAARPGDARSDAAVLASVAAALDTAAVLLDGHEVVLANRAALQLRVVRGTTLASPVLTKIVREARRTGQRVRHELELPWGGATRSVLATAAPIPDGGRVVLLLEDLTESRRVEAVRRDFVASVSHELKTPVGALLLLAETIRDGVGDDPEATRRFADRMVIEAGRLSRLVQELLDLSRLQGGEPLPKPQPVPVDGLVADALDRVRLAAESAGIELCAGECAGLVVYGDARSLVMALSNLLDNAVHYSPAGTRVAVAARLVEGAAGEEVELSVTDQGIGIPPTDLDRVFERFYRSDPARSRATGGTGLGLSIVKHVAENAGGSVSVWSAEGIGSTFTLHLPTPPEPTGALAGASSSERKEAG